jgi:hypothetical protein
MTVKKRFRAKVDKNEFSGPEKDKQRNKSERINEWNGRSKQQRKANDRGSNCINKLNFHLLPFEPVVHSTLKLLLAGINVTGYFSEKAVCNFTKRGSVETDQ